MVMSGFERVKFLWRWMVLLGMLVMPLSVHALRCDGGLVRPNDTQEAVMEKCGQPSHQSGHKWYYGDGSSFRVHEVLFVDRKVWRIRLVRPGT